MGPLKTKMRDEMILRNFSKSTIKAYLLYIQQLANYHNRSPALLTTEDIKSYLLHIINERKVSAATVNLAYSAFRFFYTAVIDRKDIIEPVARAKKHRTKPAVLSVSEVRKIFDVTENLKQKTILMTIYSAGLRVSESVNLKVADVDSQRMQMFIRCAKGKKDRYVILSAQNLEYLRLYWKEYRPASWMFYSVDDKNKSYSIRSVQRVMQDAVHKAGIKKKASVHTLRHSFATHMLEYGTEFHHLQLLMGHVSPRTTSGYLHIQKKDLLKIQSPLDMMFTNEPLSQAPGIGRGRRRVSRRGPGIYQMQ